LEFVGGRCGEIAPIYGQSGIIARERNGSAWGDFDCNFIGERNWDDDRLDFVKPIRATAKDPQLQVDFGGSAHLHGPRIL
jgi:hypothetical protein